MAGLTRILSVVLLLAAAPAWADWPAASVSLGAQENPKILQKYGGEIRNEALSAYVAEVGGKIVAVSDRPDENWRFVVLDSPEVNAFALPGGYVYVTRGLLALANNESELAAVLAHEITHVVEAHVEARQAAQKDALVNGAVSALITGILGGGEDRLGNAVRSGVETAIGEIGSYSKEQEFAADAGGIELLRRAGYRPAAQADFLASMAANAALEAEIAGRSYDETKAPFFANHPAPAERQLQALALAGDEEGFVGAGSYLARIDGMIYGQSARGGFVRGQVFIHPALGFTFEAAEGLRIENAARQINMIGPNRSTLIMSGGTATDDLVEALRSLAGQLPRQNLVSRRIDNLRRLTINGMEAATGTISLRKRGQRSTLSMTVIRFGDGLIRFAGTVRRGDTQSNALHWQTIESFRPLAPADAEGPGETHIRIETTGWFDDVGSMAAKMMVGDHAEARFRVLNGLSPTDELSRGTQVKLVLP